MLQQNGYKKAIASNSTINEIEAVISCLSLGSLIDCYCSAEQVSSGKPSPDIFLLTAQMLGADPSECLVLEDSPSGVLAANAAKIRCYAIPSRETKGRDFNKANRILDSLVDVFDYLQLDSK